MSSESVSKLRFRPRARIIRTIGDQLISGPEAAVIELVKNSYDADATRVTIRFFPPLRSGEGRITIVDDGHGMSLEDIRDKWMEPATPTKVGGRRSAIRQRWMMGSKGIGRFAAAKLGRRMGLSSVTAREGTNRAVLIPDLDWSIFNGETYLSDIGIDYVEQESAGATGTEIEVRELNEPWSREKLERLHLELRRLVSPLQDSGDDRFRIFLDLSACTTATAGFEGADIVNAVQSGPPAASAEGAERAEGAARPPEEHEVQPFPLLTASDYEVNGSFDEDGNFTGTMTVRRAGEGPKPIEFKRPLLAGETTCGVVGVRLFISDREADAVKKAAARAGLGELSAAEARAILDQTAGVAIYRQGFRVRPYGDAENDWLTLDRRRVQTPTRHLGHNQIAGYVTVAGPDESGLEERSSREGFEENGAFIRLRRMVTDLLTQVVEPRRVEFRIKAGLQNVKSTTFDEVRQVAELQKIRQLLAKLPAGEREKAEKVVEEQSSILFGRIEALEERQRVLEAKSSLGAIIAEVLHEGTQPVSFISRTSGQLQRLWQRVTERDEVAMQEFPDALHLIRQNARRLAELFKLLTPLAGGKRGAPQLFRPIEPIAEARAIFASHEKIRIEVIGGADAPEILGYPDDLNTAMVNLLGNAVYWLEESAIEEPRIEVKLVRRGADLFIYVEDNGPGVPRDFAERVFDAGFSLKTGGTGLGLNIAREAIARSGGTLRFHLDHDGGALFEMHFEVGGRNR